MEQQGWPYRPAALILGAGASMPFGFPSGEELVRRIVGDMLRGENQSEVERLFNPHFSEAARLEFGDALMRSARLSIDTFLEWNPQFAEIGKRAIAHQLIKCEKPEFVFAPMPDALRRPPRGYWYKYFFNNYLLRSGPDRFAANDLLVITFNYDRSFEFALFNAIRYSYNLSDKDAQELLTSGVRMLHLHGDLGALFASDVAPADQRDFDPVLTIEKVQVAQNRIRVVHDDTPSTLGAYEMANNALREYEAAAFLGFGYNELSLSRLRPGLNRQELKLWGTTLGLTPTEIPRIQRGLGRGLQYEVAGDCLEFWHQVHLFDPSKG
jgi:hypothetical protein